MPSIGARGCAGTPGVPTLDFDHPEARRRLNAAFAGLVASYNVSRSTLSRLMA